MTGGTGSSSIQHEHNTWWSAGIGSHTTQPSYQWFTGHWVNWNLQLLHPGTVAFLINDNVQDIEFDKQGLYRSIFLQPFKSYASEQLKFQNHHGTLQSFEVRNIIHTTVNDSYIFITCVCSTSILSPWAYLFQMSAWETCGSHQNRQPRCKVSTSGNESNCPKRHIWRVKSCSPLPLLSLLKNFSTS